MRKRRACAALAALAGLAATWASPAPSSAEPLPQPSGVLNVAHRGASDEAPEHTLASLDRAVTDHADRLSLDVRMTSDGVPVVLHDDSLLRTTDVASVFPGAPSSSVGDFTLAQIQALDAGSWFADGSYTGSRVLTLDQVLTELADAPVGLTLEAKQPRGAGGVGGVGDAIVTQLLRHPAWSAPQAPGVPRLLVESFDWGFLDTMHATYPDLPLVLLGNVHPSDLDAHPYASEIDVPDAWVDQPLVEAARARGVRVGVWTVNGTRLTELATSGGVDAITTDEPDRLLPILLGLGSTWTGAQQRHEPVVARAELRVPSSVRLGSRVPVRVRLTGAGGAPVRWSQALVQSSTGGPWSQLTDVSTDSHGSATVSAPVTDGVRLRAVAAGTTSTVTVPEVRIPPVPIPTLAPLPSYHLPAQTRATAAGARARVTRLSSSQWRALANRSWRPGCPVGRSGLRLVRASYWGFDGRRHRGELVVAARSAPRLGRVLARLYDEQQPIRALRRVERLGSWTTSVPRVLASGSTFGFTCRRTPGDPHAVGSHARGTVISLNPWENPTRVGTVGSPASWWLTHRGPLEVPSYVHTASSAVVRAFTDQGFVWKGRTGRLAEFQDTGAPVAVSP